MNIDKVISKEIPYELLGKIEASLNKQGLTFSDLKTMIKSEVVILNALTLRS